MSNNKDIKPNMDFDVQSLNAEAVEIYKKTLKNERERKYRQDSKESERGA